MERDVYLYMMRFSSDYLYLMPIILMPIKSDIFDQILSRNVMSWEGSNVNIIEINAYIPNAMQQKFLHLLLLFTLSSYYICYFT